MDFPPAAEQDWGNAVTTTNQATRSFRGLFWLLALTGLVADQASKYGVFSWLYEGGSGGSVEILPGTFRLVTDFGEPLAATGVRRSLQSVGGVEHVPKVNNGALFGIGGSFEEGGGSNTLFGIVSLAATLGIILWSFLSPGIGDRLLSAALGLILAGALGNLYDRVVFSGVRDFLHWYRWVNWPVFNVADCCLVAGAGLLLLHAFLTAPAADAAPQPAGEQQASPLQESSAASK